jgi:hypothetical protein
LERRTRYRTALEQDGCAGFVFTQNRGLAPYVYLVRVCSFTFEFHSIEQIKLCLTYFEKKIHPSSRIDIDGADSWEVQRWYERLPMYLLEEPKRQRLVKALMSAIKVFEVA